MAAISSLESTKTESLEALEQTVRRLTGELFSEKGFHRFISHTRPRDFHDGKEVKDRLFAPYTQPRYMHICSVSNYSMVGSASRYFSDNEMVNAVMFSAQMAMRVNYFTFRDNCGEWAREAKPSQRIQVGYLVHPRSERRFDLSLCHI